MEIAWKCLRSYKSVQESHKTVGKLHKSVWDHIKVFRNHIRVQDYELKHETSFP